MTLDSPLFTQNSYFLSCLQCISVWCGFVPGLPGCCLILHEQARQANFMAPTLLTGLIHKVEKSETSNTIWHRGRVHVTHVPWTFLWELGVTGRCKVSSMSGCGRGVDFLLHFVTLVIIWGIKQSTSYKIVLKGKPLRCRAVFLVDHEHISNNSIEGIHTYCLK